MKVSFQRSATTVGALVAMAVLLCLPSAAFAGTLLQSAQSFGVLAASTVTNTGPTIIANDLGLYAGTSISGFPPGTVQGTIHPTDAVARQAQIDETNAYITLSNRPFTINESGTDLGNLTLFPGVYKFSSAAQLTGPLILDFQGLNNALFLFQIGSTLTTSSASSVTVINGTATDGIFWLVGSSATLGAGTSFAGNILASDSITLVTGSKIVCGRAFAQTGAVTLDTNNITGGTCGTDFGSGGFSPTSSIQVFSPEPGTFLLLGMSLVGFAVKFSTRKK